MSHTDKIAVLQASIFFFEILLIPIWLFRKDIKKLFKKGTK